MRLSLAAAVAMLASMGSSRGAEVTATIRLSYDSNLYETPVAPTRGWVNRISLTTTGDLIRKPWFHAGLKYQGGVERYRAEPDDGTAGSGEVAVNDLSVSTGVRLTDAIFVSGTGTARLKTVNRVPGEEGYFRTAASTAAT